MAIVDILSSLNMFSLRSFDGLIASANDREIVADGGNANAVYGGSFSADEFGLFGTVTGIELFLDGVPVLDAYEFAYASEDLDFLIEDISLFDAFSRVLAGADDVSGSGGDDSLATFEGNDFVYARAGDDYVSTGAGFDYVDGGTGLDVVAFGGNGRDYDVALQGDRTIVRDAAFLEDDTLDFVERLEFADGILALDTGVNEIAGGVYRLYQAAFDRTPDNNGLSFWIDAADDGLSFDDMAEGFIRSQEFRDTYGSDLGDRAFVEELYFNILQREGESSGVEFWTGLLRRGEADRAEVLADIAESPENISLVAPAINEGIFYA